MSEPALPLVSRRKLIVAGSASLLLAGCTSDRLFSEGVDTTTTGSIGSGFRPAIGVDSNITTSAQMYVEMVDGGHTLPAIPYKKMDQEFRRQRVINDIGLQTGTILVDTKKHFLYYALSQDELVRYGVGVGKAGFEWSGTAKVGYKKEWPVWTPPKEMIERKPILAKYAGGMPPGPENPLGSRSLYLYADGRDTLYRLHGTPEWDLIGKSMSSGCIRLLNQDIIDLYSRAPIGTQVTVR